MRMSLRVGFVLLSGMVLGAPSARAQNEYVFGFGGSVFAQLNFTGGSSLVTPNTAVDQGWINSLGQHDATNTNYLVGQCSSGSCNPFGIYRDYFQFSIPSFTGSVTGAVLHIYNPDFTSNHPSETFSIFQLSDAKDLTTNVSAKTELGTTGTTDVGLFNALGPAQTNTLWGSVSVSDANDAGYVDVTLNSSFLSFLNAGESINRQVYFVGRLSSIDSVTPEPATISLMALGLVGMAGPGIRRRKRSR